MRAALSDRGFDGLPFHQRIGVHGEPVLASKALVKRPIEPRLW
jgi:hypothetical protein